VPEAGTADVAELGTSTANAAATAAVASGSSHHALRIYLSFLRGSARKCGGNLPAFLKNANATFLIELSVK
jgi:hypothetical protein